VRDEGSPTVTLHWTLDGVTQTPISMSQVGATSIYEGTISSQTDGSRVSYVVEAEDAATQSAFSLPQGYFSGTSDVADVRINDADGILVVSEYAARIEGNLTAEPGLFHDFVSMTYVQDSTGGIQVFDNSLLSLDRGDLVEFVGELEQFAGQTELNIAQDFGGYGHTDNGTGSAPSPALITVADADEDYEGVLVRIDDVTITSGSIAGLGGGNSYLTITDDGGTSTMDIKIDEDTDIPGAGTPTTSFDVIGVLSQFDAWPAMDSGYQLVPRERADILSDEVNVPDVVIHEIHADPHPGQGDANNDGNNSSTQDEFIELVNTTFDTVDVSGWTISDGVGVRHTFANGTEIPPREALVVFSGGSPTGDFGHADDNGLVFTASSGQLGLNNGGDTITLKDDLSATVQAVTYGSEGGNDVSLTRGVDLSNAPLDEHDNVSTGGARYSPGTWAEDGLPFAVAPGEVLISEVMYDATGSDDGSEWIELVNVGGYAIDLAKRPISLGWGGDDYETGGITLDSGTISTCDVFVVGGPDSDSDNANPTFDEEVNWSPDLQNSGTTADGVGLFNFPYFYVTASTLPIDAVIYGTTNTNCLLDESGSCASVDVGDVSSGGTIERTSEAGAWQTQSTPTPGSSSLTTSGSCGEEPTCLDASTLATGDLVLSEVLYDPDSSDNGWEWIELYNNTEEDVCLTGLSLGWGGSDYTYGQYDLTGTVGPGDTWVLGGPSSGSGNSSPTYDDGGANFSPDLQNGGSESDGVALFLDVSSNVGSSTVPYDAVIYDSPNSNCLLDESGSCATPDVGDASSTESIERTSIAGAWSIQSTPTPGSTPLP
ncbi:MAG TPA: lamin tail domain-containing protein, partial [Thermoanaerobaculia bacterium]|nr:lamin tail domain-containing protein [Thermoanaerobaculia bacterium]